MSSGLGERLSPFGSDGSKVIPRGYEAVAWITDELSAIGQSGSMRKAPDEAYPGALLRVSAAYAWRLLILAAAAYGVVLVLGRLRDVVVPFAAALLLTALLQPYLAVLRGRGLSQGTATVVSFLSAVVVIGGLLTLVVIRAVNQFPRLGLQLDQVLPHLRHWLENGPLHLSAAIVDNLNSTITKLVGSHSSTLLSAAATTGRTILRLVAGLLLTLFITVFLLYDGPRVWRFACLAAPRGARPQVDSAGRAAWTTLSHYVRGTLVVAVFHGVAVAVVLGVLGVPLVLPLAVLVAFGSFVPIVGALITGVVAVGVAGVSHGLTDAVVVTLVLVADNQVESHLLQPFVVGRYVRLHPLATVLALGAGAVLAGILGAIFAVPMVAAISAAVRSAAAGPPTPAGPDRQPRPSTAAGTSAPP